MGRLRRTPACPVKLQAKLRARIDLIYSRKAKSAEANLTTPATGTASCWPCGTTDVRGVEDILAWLASCREFYAPTRELRRRGPATAGTARSDNRSPRWLKSGLLGETTRPLSRPARSGRRPTPAVPWPGGSHTPDRS